MLLWSGAVLWPTKGFPELNQNVPRYFARGLGKGITRIGNENPWWRERECGGMEEKDRFGGGGDGDVDSKNKTTRRCLNKRTVNRRTTPAAVFELGAEKDQTLPPPPTNERAG